ncbi:type 4a pilus biogenesis protein PilO [Gloeothece verrucosa]|uniref:Type II and III secretion system protein n=1 Tax=Gloeothece verrucosa (strain PCC 7822) TaxID=497965 RepID=E0UHF1_GLOV7|nr:type 4a pilus biogenesis protein PilO [Gloeothece verrucosa]ADN12092.1 type II and III secretion system protein [Gloeothece verrucosa PCC 7822]
MTFSDEYTPEEGQDFEDSSKYPVAFGITFTPKVSGIAFAILGGIGAIYILLNMVMPAYTTYQEQKTEEASLLDNVNQQNTGNFAKKLAAAEQELQQKQALRKEILAFFGNEKSLDTLLLDINGFFKSRNVELVSFEPQGEVTVIDDGSLGQGVNQKLKRQSINIEMKGEFEQSQSLLRDLEKLQPLILIKNLVSEPIDSKQKAGVFDRTGKLTPAKLKLKTTFLLEVILPVSFGDLPPPPPDPSSQSAQPPQ